MRRTVQLPTRYTRARRRHILRDITYWDPFRDMHQLRAEIEGLIDRAASGAKSAVGAPWRPVSDVVETDDAIMITAELPGCKDEDVEVLVRDRVLTIRGTRTMEESSEDEHYRRVERCTATSSGRSGCLRASHRRTSTRRSPTAYCRSRSRSRRPARRPASRSPAATSPPTGAVAHAPVRVGRRVWAYAVVESASAKAAGFRSVNGSAPCPSGGESWSNTARVIGNTSRCSRPSGVPRSSDERTRGSRRVRPEGRPLEETSPGCLRAGQRLGRRGLGSITTGM